MSIESVDQTVPMEEEVLQNSLEEIYINDDEVNATTGSAEKLQKGRDINRFPHTRIRMIMKMEPDLNIASQESVYLITKAAVSWILSGGMVFTPPTPNKVCMGLLELLCGSSGIALLLSC